MARYKYYSYEQGVMIPVNFSSQIVPGTIEHTISWLVDNRIDLSGISKRFRNDATGAPAYDPAILLKIVLLAYSRGIISSRMIMKACRECELRSRCVKSDKTRYRTLYVVEKYFNRNYSDEMREKIDTPEGREVYSRRMGIVEPVFGNIRCCKNLSRFTLRTKDKVNIQWVLYTAIHNIEKISRYGTV